MLGLKLIHISTLPANCMESPYLYSHLVAIYVNVNMRSWQYLEDFSWGSEKRF